MVKPFRAITQSPIPREHTKGPTGALAIQKIFQLVHLGLRFLDLLLERREIKAGQLAVVDHV